MNTLEEVLLEIGLADVASVLPIVVKNPSAVANLKATLLAIRNDINLMYPGE